jgi:hypothetical protein
MFVDSSDYQLLLLLLYKNPVQVQAAGFLLVPIAGSEKKKEENQQKLKLGTQEGGKMGGVQ